MTKHEIIYRLGRLDIRDAEKEDYAALYLAIQIIKESIKDAKDTEVSDEDSD